MIEKELVAASTEPLILSLLSKGESYGYELIQEVKKLSGDKIKWTDGMLYPVLHRMEDNAWIKSRWVEVANGRNANITQSKKTANRPSRKNANNGLWFPRSSAVCGEDNMFNLEHSITEWRRKMLAAGIRTPVPLEELENHLREDIGRQVQSGLDEEKSFEIAVQQIGDANALKTEFKKMKNNSQRKHAVAVVCAGLVFLFGILMGLQIVLWSIAALRLPRDEEFRAEEIGAFMLGVLMAISAGWAAFICLRELKRARAGFGAADFWSSGKLQRLKPEFIALKKFVGTKNNRMNMIKKLTHALILAIFGFNCWILWSLLGLVPVAARMLHGQLPGFTALCVSLQPVLVVLPLLAAVYCLWVWCRKADLVPSWIGFFAAATGALVLVALPTLVAAYLPLISILNQTTRIALK